MTGAGSVVGQGIVKALRLSALDVTCIAADIGPLNAGLYRADESVILPAVEDADALTGIVAIIRQARADAVFLGSEFDLVFYAAHRAEIETRTGATVIVSDPETVAVADDKFKTVEMLRDLELPAPESFAVGTLAQACAAANSLGYPVMLKERFGTSARGVHQVSDDDEVRRVFRHMRQPMVQELLQPNNEHTDATGLGAEYTCSVFTAADGEHYGPFVARRRLRGGSSWIIESCHRPEFSGALRALGEGLPSRGSINVQLMDTERGPVSFELNARSSGTTAVRAHFGFNEPEMAVRSFVLGETLSDPRIRKGLCLRYEEEIFLDDVLAIDLADEDGLPRGEVHPWF